jgi:hypothetical protein
LLVDSLSNRMLSGSRILLIRFIMGNPLKRGGICPPLVDYSVTACFPESS